MTTTQHTPSTYSVVIYDPSPMYAPTYTWTHRSGLTRDEAYAENAALLECGVFGCVTR